MVNKMKTSNEIVIIEYQFLQTKDENKRGYIDKKTFNELETFILDNEDVAQYLKITRKRPYGKVLQAQNYVGVIQTKSEITIEILPKIADIEDEKKEKEIIIKDVENSKKVSL